tara:strand:- start:772 stop:1047 length:276 start_codon:yes stop_codon:yes gene_type:complete
MSNGENGGVLKFQSVIQTLTLVTLIGSVASVFLMVGRRDAMIASNESKVGELWNITQDLVKSQVLGAAQDGDHQRQLADLKRRIERLEQND